MLAVRWDVPSIKPLARAFCRSKGVVADLLVGSNPTQHFWMCNRLHFFDRAKLKQSAAVRKDRLNVTVLATRRFSQGS